MGEPSRGESLKKYFNPADIANSGGCGARTGPRLIPMHFSLRKSNNGFLRYLELIVVCLRG